MSKPIPWVKYEKIDENAGRFIVSPLSRGMGTTLGNSLRRVLLSSLEGHAVTAIKIDGVQHEFSAVANIVEDVLDIVANIKGIVFKSGSDEPRTITLDFSGKGKVFAKDIQTGSDLEIVNPEWYIAEVSEKGKIRIEMRVEKGKGYAPAEVHKREDDDIHTITVDSSFSPIIRVNHQVENIRVGKELDYDSLTLEVWTNGSVSPEDAVKEASSLLVKKFELFKSLNEKPEEQIAQVESSEVDEAKASALNMTIDDLELSARSSNCLKRAGITTVAELIDKDLAELTKIKNFGKKSADEINSKLQQYGLLLKES